MKRRFTIIGNNIAAIVSALELGKSGCEVELINPLPNWGGHFNGIEVEGHVFDIGRITFDFVSYNNDANSDPLTYNPELRNDVGRFYAHIEEFVHKIIATREVTTPSMFYEGKWCADTYQADSLECVSLLDAGKTPALREELENVVGQPNSEFHASRKKDSEQFLRESYETISKLNHGNTFHQEFIEPVLNKTLFDQSDKVLALFHRLPWFPLYYPESILAEIKGKPHPVKTLAFHYPDRSDFRQLIQKLMSLVEQHPSIQITSASLKTIDLNRLSFDRTLVWTLHPGIYLAEVIEGYKPVEEAKIPMTFAFAGVKTNNIKREFSSVVLTDETFHAYRVNNQTNCSGIELALSLLSIEFNTAYLASKGIESEESISEAVRHVLLGTGIIDSVDAIDFIEIKRVPKGLRIPSRENYDNFYQVLQRLRHEFPNVECIGASSGFATASFNDQLVQAMQLARKVEVTTVKD